MHYFPHEKALGPWLPKEQRLLSDYVESQADMSIGCI